MCHECGAVCPAGPLLKAHLKEVHQQKAQEDGIQILTRKVYWTNKRGLRRLDPVTVHEVFSVHTGRRLTKSQAIVILRKLLKLCGVRIGSNIRAIPNRQGPQRGNGTEGKLSCTVQFL